MQSTWPWSGNRSSLLFRKRELYTLRVLSSAVNHSYYLCTEHSIPYNTNSGKDNLFFCSSTFRGEFLAPAHGRVKSRNVIESSVKSRDIEIRYCVAERM